MNRTEAIAVITNRLAALDDAAVKTVAEFVDDIATSSPVRALSARELGLIEQSKGDFAADRTVSLDDARAHSTAFLDRLRAKYPTAP